jgi:tripartite-type tricarboxylate transporter receptor subunit TctC
MRLAAFAAALLLSSVAAAQTWPTKPLKIVVAFPPGGSTDLAARALGDKLAPALGQPVVVENRPGASGNIGAEVVARAAPDGHTLLMAATSFATAPAFFENLPWDPVKDFAPVSLVATTPIVIVVNPAVPARDVKELVAYSKANPGKLAIASPGAATLVRLSGEMFKQAAGLDWLTINYKGGPPAVADLLGGHAQVMFAIISDVLSHVQAGTLRPLAVTTAQRSAVVPDLPTIKETGVLDFESSTWLAVVAPAGTPSEAVQRLNREIVQILGTKEMKERFLSFGADAATSTPEALGDFVKAEVAKIAKVARETGAKIE